MAMAKRNMGSALFSVMTTLLLLTYARAAPMDLDDDSPSSELGAHTPALADALDAGNPSGWDLDHDPMDSAALRRILMQLERSPSAIFAPRAIRQWNQPIDNILPRGWGGAWANSRAARQYRADKRQSHFKQCYFNPVSCFGK